VSGNTRVTGKEQFYTPPPMAEQIIEQITQLTENRLLLEPAGGTGSFVEAAINKGFKVISFDIEPKHSMVKTGNFLEQKLDVQNAITVSNPPFGRNNSLSIPFFNHAAKYSELIIFIVPRSWRKWSIQNRLDKNFHLIKDYDLNINYVDSNNNYISNKNTLKTCVQFWSKSAPKRKTIKIKDMGIIQKTNHLEADAALTIFGYGCGKVSTNFEKKPNSTKMFLKLKHEKALEALQNVDYSKFSLNTAYTKALSIQEINYLLNEFIYKESGLCLVDE